MDMKEIDLQTKIFKWALIQSGRYPELNLLNASQNGLKTTSQLAGYKAKLAGMKKGFPDLFLPVARNGYHGLFIELKREANKAMNIKAGVLSPEQKEWLNNLNAQGYLAVVCYGFESATQAIFNYLRGVQDDKSAVS